ncbi:MAG: hypothetical protein AB2758_22210, partial [Candidatus Thiodiazotropha endolucinida]
MACNQFLKWISVYLIRVSPIRLAKHAPPHPPQCLGIGALGGDAFGRDQRAYDAFLSVTDHE